jgi:hypothetical protein
MQTETPVRPPTFSPGPPHQPYARVGYAVTIIVNAVMLYVVNNLLEWGWPAFLTNEFEDLLPYINVSIVVGLVFNVAYLISDANRFRAFGEMVNAAVGFVVAIRTYQIFPFDFSDYTGFPWNGFARFIIIVAIFGTAIGTIVQLVKLVTGAPQRRPRPS